MNYKILIVLLVLMIFSCEQKKVSRLPAPDIKVSLELQTGHLANITAADFSYDNKLIISASMDNTVRLWDLKTGREMKKLLVTSKKGVHSIAASSNGKFIACGDGSGIVSIWNAKDYSLLYTLKAHDAAITVLKFITNDSRIITASNDGDVKLWDLNTQLQIFTLKGHTKPVKEVFFSNDGAYLSSSSEDSTIRIWDMKKAKEYKRFYYPVGTLSFAFFSTTKLLATNNKPEKKIQLWEIKNWKEIEKFKGEYFKIGIMRNEQEIYAIGSDQIEIHNYMSGALTKIVYQSDGIGEGISKLNFSNSGEYLIMVINHAEIRVVDIASGKMIASIGKTILDASKLAISPNGTFLIANNNLSSGALISSIPLDSSHEVSSLNCMMVNRYPMVFRNENEILIEKSYRKMAKFNILTGKITQEFSGDYSSPLLVCPTESYFIAKGNLNFGLYDYADGRLIQEIPNTGSYFKFGAFSPDGKYLLIWSLSSTKIFEMPSCKELKSFQSFDFDDIKEFTFDSDGKYITIEGSKNKIIIRDILNGKIKTKLADVKFKGITEIKISPDKKYLAIGDKQGHAFLYDIKEKLIIKSIQHQTQVTSIVFSPNGDFIFSSSTDGQIKMWETSPGREVATMVGIESGFDNKGNRLADYIFYTPEGRFDGKEHAIRRILLLKMGNSPLPMDKYWHELYTQDLIQKLISIGAEN